MNEQRGLEDRILHIDKKLVRVDTVLERVVEISDKNANSLADIAMTLSRMNQIEEHTDKALIRVHNRFGETEKKIENLEKKMEEKVETLNPVFTVLKYPKWAVLAIIGTYAFAISDIREHIIAAIKMWGA